MGSLLYGLVMIGVGWLVFWSIADHEKPSKTWWPFAIRGLDKIPQPAQNGWRARRPAATRTVVARGIHPDRTWNRSGS